MLIDVKLLISCSLCDGGHPSGQGMVGDPVGREDQQRRGEMQVCGGLWSVISGKVSCAKAAAGRRQRKSPRPRSDRQLAYLPPPLPPVGPTNGSQGKAHRPVLQKLWNQKNIVRETFSFQRAHFPVDIFHFSAAIFANLRKDLTFLHNCIF